MYKIEYTHLDVNGSPTSAAFLIGHYVNPNSCFSRMAFETFDDAMSAISDIVQRIADWGTDHNKRMRLRKNDWYMAYRMRKDEKGVHIQYCYNGYWYDFAHWTIVKDETSSRSQIVFLDDHGVRCTYRFDGLQEMVDCIASDKYLAANREILLVSDEYVTIYSSMALQPTPDDAVAPRNAIRLVFRGKDGLRRCYDFDTPDEMVRTAAFDQDLKENAGILALYNRGATVYSSLANNGTLAGSDGLRKILDWFVPAKIELPSDYVPPEMKPKRKPRKKKND